MGSTTFNLSKTVTTTSTPKDIQMNTNLQTKQKSTIKPDKLLTSNLFGHQQTITDEIFISDSEEREKEIRIHNWIPNTVNQRVRKKTQLTENNNYRNNNYINTLTDNNDLNWEQEAQNYNNLKNEITEQVTNHTNKLIDNIENRFQQINENMERN